jgi:hypothetical protein
MQNRQGTEFRMDPILCLTSEVCKGRSRNSEGVAEDIAHAGLKLYECPQRVGLAAA